MSSSHRRVRTLGEFVVPRLAGAVTAGLAYLPCYLAGWVAPLPVWVFYVVVVVGTTGTIVTQYLWTEPSRRWQIHLRYAAQCASITGIIYTTGWGPGLAVVYTKSLADNVAAAGSDAIRPGALWALAGIGVGQLGIAGGVIPSLIASPGVHGLALLSAVGLGFVYWLLGVTTRRQESAERSLRRSRARLEDREARLREAQVISRLGSWEWDPDTGEIVGSTEFFRILQVDGSRTEVARQSEERSPEADAEAPQAGVGDASPEGTGNDSVEGTGDVSLKAAGDDLHRDTRDSAREDSRDGSGEDPGTISLEGLMELVHAEDRDSLRDGLDDCVSDGEPFHLECRVVRPSEEVRWVEVRGRPVEDGEVRSRARSDRDPGRPTEGGDASSDGRGDRTRGPAGETDRAAPAERTDGTRGNGIRGTLQDITDRRELEEQLLQSMKLRGIGELAAGVAHDFNNLLLVIRGFAELLLEDMDDDDPRTENVEQIDAATDQAADLTAQLLAFGRRQILRPEVLDLDETVEEMLPLLRRLIRENVEIEFDPGPHLHRVKADPARVKQVIMNLSINARDAMPDGGVLAFETSEVELDDSYVDLHPDVDPGPYVLLTVSDTGVGMDEEMQERVFEPFFTTKEKGKGTGLGLATVYGFVKQSGGHVGVYSEPGQGTTFKIYLPRVAEAEAELRRAPAAVEAGRGSETILVAEDNRQLLDLFRQILERRGYRVLTASDGDAALDLAREHDEPIDLMISDVVLPGSSGEALAEAFRQRQPGAGVLFISGYARNSIAHHGVLETDVPFLAKPFSGDDLLQAVRRILDASGDAG